MNSKFLISFLALYAILICTCATPVGPTGGPRDDKGPQILFTQPETGTTNFDGNEVVFFFDEYVKRASLKNNITIEPDFGASYTTKWKKKRLIITFDHPLPDSTTIILTLGGSVTDTKNNKIGAPKLIAFSTGDVIDKGSINGRIKNSNTGEGESEKQVALYRTPINLNKPYNYTAETDTGGNFKFSFLKEGNYKAFYFDDRNRNKIWEPPREYSQAFRVDTISLAKEDSLNIGELYLQMVDTLAPKLQGVGLFSDKRMRLRFNEDILLQDSVHINVLDTLGNSLNSAYPLYIPENEQFILFAQSDSSLKVQNTYEINIHGITDHAGNSVETDVVRFTGSSQADTTLQRIIRVETDTGLFPEQSFVVTYASDIRDRMIVDSVVVVEGDVTFDDWPTIGVDKNQLFIGPQESWIDGIDYQFLIWNPLSQRRALHTPEIWDANEMGELEISITSEDSLATYFYQLENEKNELQFYGTMGIFKVIENLPPLEYRFTIFKDSNENKKWDKGSVSPYSQPEIYLIRPTVRIKTGFTSSLLIDF